ncbi:MAG: ABC transporter permease [Fusobacteriaceae bacterium]
MDKKKIFIDNSFVFSFLILSIIAVFINPTYFSWINFSTLLLQVSIKGIIALGMTLIIISGEIDLSVGSQIALIAGIGVTVLNKTESVVLTFLFCIVFGIILGTFNGILTTKGKIASFIVSLATMSAYRSIIVQLGQGGPFNVGDEMLMSFRTIASGSIFGIPNLAIIFVVLTTFMTILMSKTKFGRYVYAVGSNKQASFLTGINVSRIKTYCFAITGGLVGCSAFLLSSRLTSIAAANAGTAFELDAIAAVAIGGTTMSGGRGKIVGTFFGAIMLQMIEGILVAAKIPPFLSGLVKGIIIVLAVIFQKKKGDRE